MNNEQRRLGHYSQEGGAELSCYFPPRGITHLPWTAKPSTEALANPATINVMGAPPKDVWLQYVPHGLRKHRVVILVR